MRSRNRGELDSHGDVHFATSRVVGHTSIFTRRKPCQIFTSTLGFYQERGDFVLLAWGLMPDHFHLVLKRIESESISAIIGNIKRFTSRRIRELLRKEGALSILGALREAAERERAAPTAFWQYRFDNFTVTSLEALEQKVDYIHRNPVTRGLVDKPQDWALSSAAEYAGIGQSIVPIDRDWNCLGFGTLPSGKDS